MRKQLQLLTVPLFITFGNISLSAIQHANAFVSPLPSLYIGTTQTETNSNFAINNVQRINGVQLEVATSKTNEDKASIPSTRKVEISKIVKGRVQKDEFVQKQQGSSALETSAATTTDDEYKRGLATIALITLLFSSNSPVLHAAFVNSTNPPPVLLLNAATSTIALLGLITIGPFLNSIVPLPSTLQVDANQCEEKINGGHILAGVELGLWKTLGTTANLFGLSLTTANHAAFLIQLTTLIVPSVQGMMGVPLPKRIWTSISLALGGIFLFTQDATSSITSVGELMTSNALIGDALCVLAAGFYATYDLRLFEYGKKVPPLPLIKTKIGVQALLSCLMLAFFSENGGGLSEASNYIHELMSNSSSDAILIGSAALWSGLAVNAIAPFLQVGGQQTVGAARAQIVYASQPLCAAILSFFALHETLEQNGLIGGFLFLSAIYLAASAYSPDPDCGVDNCEV